LEEALGLLWHRTHEKQHPAKWVPWVQVGKVPLASPAKTGLAAAEVLVLGGYLLSALRYCREGWVRAP